MGWYREYHKQMKRLLQPSEHPLIIHHPDGRRIIIEKERYLWEFFVKLLELIKWFADKITVEEAEKDEET